MPWIQNSAINVPRKSSGRLAAGICDRWPRSSTSRFFIMKTSRNFWVCTSANGATALFSSTPIWMIFGRTWFWRTKSATTSCIATLPSSRTEYEANAFAAHLLMDTDAVYAELKEGCDEFTLAQKMNCNINLTLIKLQEMAKLGYDIRPSDSVDSQFLKKIRV